MQLNINIHYRKAHSALFCFLSHAQQQTTRILRLHKIPPLLELQQQRLRPPDHMTTNKILVLMSEMYVCSIGKVEKKRTPFQQQHHHQQQKTNDMPKTRQGESDKNPNPMIYLRRRLINSSSWAQIEPSSRDHQLTNSTELI